MENVQFAEAKKRYMRAKLIGQTVENAKRDTGKKTASGETGWLTEFGENVSHCAII